MEPYVALESALADWIGTTPDHMVACNSGTAALHLALEALQLPKYASVLVPDYTMIACARVCTLANLQPLFMDCDDTLNLDSTLLHNLFRLARLKPGQRYIGGGSIEALLAVHIYGRRCHMDAIHGQCAPYHIPVIEDMAELHDVQPHSHSAAACWSFYRNKVVAGEEGGAVYFKDVAQADLARQLRSLGFTSKHDFQHIPRGHNYRLANSLASLILQSLGDIKTNLRFREYIEQIYDGSCPTQWRQTKRDCPWVYDLRIPGMTCEQQDAVIANLHAIGCTGARHGFKPMSMQAEYNTALTRWTNSQQLNSHRAASEVIYLPIHPSMLTQGHTFDPRLWFDSIRATLSATLALTSH